MSKFGETLFLRISSIYFIFIDDLLSDDLANIYQYLFSIQSDRNICVKEKSLNDVGQYFISLFFVARRGAHINYVVCIVRILSARKSNAEKSTVTGINHVEECSKSA